MTWDIKEIPEFKKQFNKDKFLIDIANNFKKKIPKDSHYYNRLLKEFKLIVKFNFSKCFLQVIEILNMTKGIPHIIRGSSGSSLTCYLLGISSFDPIKYNISLQLNAGAELVMIFDTDAKSISDSKNFNNGWGGRFG